MTVDFTYRPRHISFTQGDGLRLPIQLQDGQGGAIHLDGLTVRAQARPFATSETVYDLEVEVELPDLVTLIVTPEVSARMARQHVFDVEVVDAEGWPRTVDGGTLIPTREVTR